MIPLWIVITVVVVCLLTEAFFSGSEIALVSADRARIRQKAETGDLGAQMAQRFLERPQWFLATTLIGTNVSTVTSATVVTLATIQRLGPEDGNWVAVAMLSPCILLFGEVVPKTLFQQKADAIVTRIAIPLRLVSVVLAPAVFLVGKVAELVGRGLRLQGRRNLVTRDELLMVLESQDAQNSKEITADEREIISNLLDAGADTVYDIKVPLSEVVALPEDASLEEAAAEFAVRQHSRMPVYRERVDQVVGLLHAFDVLRAQVSAEPRPQLVAEIMRPPIFCPEAQPTRVLMLELQRERQHMAVVVDEYGGATGICTLEDILEEIVGDIRDEHDREAHAIVAEGPGSWRVGARTDIEDVNRELGIELPESDEYETLAGLILERLKRIPRRGESLDVDGVELTVLGASERAIETVRIKINKRRRKAVP